MAGCLFLGKYGLVLKEDKTFIGRLEEGFIFLGYHFDSKGKTVPVNAADHLEERLEEQWLQDGALSVGEKIKKAWK